MPIPDGWDCVAAGQQKRHANQGPDAQRTSLPLQDVAVALGS
jgi:hypothetical protein